MGLARDGSAVDAQQPGLGAAEVATQPRLVPQGADEFVAAGLRPRIRSFDQVLQVFGESLAHGGVAGGGLGVVADHESFGAGAVVGTAARADPDFLDPQVAGDLTEAAGRASAAAASVLVWRSFSAWM